MMATHAPLVSKEFLGLTENGGEMGRLIRVFDWSQTAVGPFERWPQSLKTALSICLGSKFPMFVWWGKELTVFYNDAYIPFTGLKHPRYLGSTAREQWEEIWHELRPLTEQVMQTGRATWAESMLLFMTRKGFLEETYFTFSYSPIRDEKGAVGGIINPCQETTDRILGERRLKTLHDLASCEGQTLSQVAELAMQALGKNICDVPFASIYLASGTEKNHATLLKSFGIRAGTQAFPKTLDWSSQDVWQIGRVNSIRLPERISGLRDLFFENLPQAPYAERPDSAYVLPLTIPNQEAPIGFLILGISSRLMFDERYQEFFGLVRRQISTLLSTKV